MRLPTFLFDFVAPNNHLNKYLNGLLKISLHEKMDLFNI